MKKVIKCNGNCDSCEHYASGEVEYFEPCAIAAVNRRTFDMNVRLSNIEALLQKIAETKKSNKTVPISADEISINKNNILEDDKSDE